MKPNRRFNVKMKNIYTIITLILVSLIALCSCSFDTSTSGTITGRVILEDGISAADVQVSLTGYDLDYASYIVNPDENGYFRIEDVYPYTYTVSYSKINYIKATKEMISVKAGKTVNLGTVTLAINYGFLTGKVTDAEGNPIPNAFVTVSGSGMHYSATADANGNYSISAKPGKYTDITISSTNPCRYLQDTLSKAVSSNKETKLDDYSLSPDTHNYKLVEIEESTETKAGHRKYRCTNCDVEKTVAIPLRTNGARWAGIRASSYGLIESFAKYPGINDMVDCLEKMESCYAGSNGTVILIVGVVSEDLTKCVLDFPLSKEITNVIGSDVDFYEDYLNALDNAGYSVWLQVEPGNADLVELAKEVINHYKHHSSVKGFGIDVEWYKRADNRNGMKLSSDGDEPKTVSKVLTAVKAINSDYTVFVKHWDERWLPDPKEGLVFVNDSQGFRSSESKTALQRMCEEFADWAETYAPCPVMFQIGYDSDESKIWGSMENPAEELGMAIIAECNTSNDIGIIWVDFTLKEAMSKITED